MFIGQVGEAPHLSDPREDLSLNRNRVNFIKTLIDLGFESIVDYDEVSKCTVMLGEPSSFFF